MSQEIVPQVFENLEFGAIRALCGDGGEPWFVASDIAKALGYRDAAQLTRLLDDDEKGTQILRTHGGDQKMATLNESGFYRAIMQRRSSWVKDDKKREFVVSFQRWVTHEVLPALRRDGAYVASDGDEDDATLMARALLAAKRAIDRKDALIAEMKPKAFFADSVSRSKTSVLVGVMAKILNQNGYRTGQNRFFKTLCNDGYLIGTKGRNYHMPTQRALDMGLFEVKESTRTHSDGHTSIDRTTLVTGKGQVYFVNRYCGRVVE